VRRGIGSTFLSVLLVLLAIVSGVGCSKHVQSARFPTPIPGTEMTETPSPTMISTVPPATPERVATPAASPTATPSVAIDCAPAPPDQFETCQATEPGGFTMTFYLFLPHGYQPRMTYPMVLLLSGGGQRADADQTAEQNRAAMLSDPYTLIWGPGITAPDSADVQGNWPCFVVIPQVVKPNRFVDQLPGAGSYTLAVQPNDALRMSKEVVDSLQLIYTDIDPNRRYVTGLSMGGYGTWEAIERWPDYFAAAAPIAGAGDPSKAAELVNLPIWAFHGDADTTVPVSGSRDMIAAIRAAGGHPRYTEYAGEEHGVWVNPYTLLGHPSPTPDFFAWLFAQHK
jgi:predicted peptidase